MCGITGYLLKNKSERDNTTIREMLTLQKHRGPDDSGIVGIDTKNNSHEEIPWREILNFQEKVDLLFGFNRLSILDLSQNGHQPMVSENGNVILMMNGEVYNAFDYRDELIKAGYSFRSTTDTEVVLNLYQEYGIRGMAERLNGMFALVIYDRNLRKLFIARDRFGIKPMYILNTSDFIAFSSEMKSFKALPGYSFRLNEEVLDEYLLFRNAIHDTLFKDIVNIVPGTIYEIDPGSSEIREHKYYSFTDHNYTDSSDASVFDEYFRDAVKRQMISDVKLGTQLSGGVDSSMVTYLASGFVPAGSLETISIIFDNPSYSEEKWIEKVSERLDLVSHRYVMDAGTYFGNFMDAGWHFEQPINHPNTIGIYLLSEQARKHVTVLLSGEGADELLAGYSHFTELESPYFSRYFVSQARKNRKRILRFFSLYTDPLYRMIMATAFGTPSLASDLYPGFSLERALAGRRTIAASLNGSRVNVQRRYELMTYLPDLLMRQDKMSMAHSIENRVPFLDNNFVNLNLQLPDDIFIKGSNGQLEGKSILKKSCNTVFGHNFTHRRKQGFGIPLREFMGATVFRELWHERIQPGIQQRSIFRPEPVTAWMNGLGNCTPFQLDYLWMMFSFEVWAQSYLDDSYSGLA